MQPFPDWNKIAAIQDDQDTGCIPTIYETMLKAAGASGIDYSTFQKEFDLEKRGLAKNHFVPIAEAIQKEYPKIGFVKTWPLTKEELVGLHDKYEGGSEISYLKSWQ